MKRLTATLCLTIAVLLGTTGMSSVIAQMVNHAVGAVDIFADEKWEVVSACPNSPALKVEIVDIFRDKKVCISGGNTLDWKTLKL